MSEGSRLKITSVFGSRRTPACLVGASTRRRLGYSSVQRVVTQNYSDVLELDRQFSEQLGINVLRPEAKLLLILSQAGTLTIKQALSLSGLSYRGFYLLMNRLLAQGLVEINGDENDGRVRKVSLARSLL